MIRIALVALGLAVVSGCAHQGGAPLSSREQAQLHLTRSEYDQALPLLERLHRAAPSDLTVARDLTLAHVKTHRAQALITRLEKSEQGRPPAVTRYMLGLARFSGPAEADRAISDFEAAAAHAPNEAEFHYRLGLALLESEKYAEALPPLTRAHQLAGERRDVLLPLAKALHRHGDRPAAVAALRKLVEAGPTPEEVKVARALMDAISDPFAAFPRSAKAKLEEGLVWLHERDVPQQAILAFEELALEYPDLAVVHQLLGLCYQRIDDAGRAVEEFKRAIELGPEDGRTPLYLALLYQSRQRGDQAVPYYERALELNPLLDDAWAALGDHLLARRELLKAREAFRVLTFLQPDSAPARGKYALVLQLQGDFAAADRALRAIVEKDPGNVEFMLRLGVLHLERRNQARTDSERKEAAGQAERWLRKVLEAQPENAVASRALQSLHAP